MAGCRTEKKNKVLYVKNIDGETVQNTSRVVHSQTTAESRPTVTSDNQRPVGVAKERTCISSHGSIRPAQAACHAPGPVACSRPHCPLRLPLTSCETARGAHRGGEEHVQNNKAWSRDPVAGSQLMDLSFDHDYRLLWLRAGCLPDAATPCREPINKQWEGGLFEYFASTTTTHLEIPVMPRPSALNCCFVQLPCKKEDVCESPRELLTRFQKGNFFFYEGNHKILAKGVCNNHGPDFSPPFTVCTWFSFQILFTFGFNCYPSIPWFSKLFHSDYILKVLLKCKTLATFCFGFGMASVKCKCFKKTKN